MACSSLENARLSQREELLHRCIVAPRRALAIEMTALRCLTLQRLTIRGRHALLHSFLRATGKGVSYYSFTIANQRTVSQGNRTIRALPDLPDRIVLLLVYI